MIFSLIIASKNEEEDIHLAIESSINQTYENKEILVVDDSTDRTREIVNKYLTPSLFALSIVSFKDVNIGS